MLIFIWPVCPKDQPRCAQRGLPAPGQAELTWASLPLPWRGGGTCNRDGADISPGLGVVPFQSRVNMCVERDCHEDHQDSEFSVCLNHCPPIRHHPGVLLEKTLTKSHRNRFPQRWTSRCMML